MKSFFLAILCLLTGAVFSQSSVSKDSALRAAFRADSIKIEKQYAENARWERFAKEAIFPVLNFGTFSGVIPVKDPVEIPDPAMEYKLLFELTVNNPDSAAGEINAGLIEVARRINLHVASGIPVKKIIPVLVIHAGALNAFTNNDYYQKKYKTDNPNLKIIESLKNLGARFIGCGQAMAVLGMDRSIFIPEIRVSVTAQTALSNYQLKGFVLYNLSDLK